MTEPSFLDAYRSEFSLIPPALTSGLVVFMLIFLIIESIFPSFKQALVLLPNSLFTIDLNRLSFYPMIHLNVFHYIMNVWALIPILGLYELNNGTVRTGIVLNLLAVFPGIVYCLVTSLLGWESAVAGSSLWVFAFLSYFAYLDYERNPVWQISPTVKVPTWTTPFVPLIVSALLVPGSSFLGHVIGIGFGFALAKGYLKILYAGTTNVVEKIEDKLEPLISLIPRQFKFIKEVHAREIRAAGTSAGGTALPVVEPVASGSGSGSGSGGTSATPAFQGQGQLLGE